MSAEAPRLVGWTSGHAAVLPRDRLVEELCDAAARAEARGLVLDSSLPEAAWGPLAERLSARRAELPTWALCAPCPASRAATADLASAERDESEAACAAAEATMARAAELGAGLVLVSLGEVAALRRDWPAVRRAYLRGELADDARGRERFLRARAAAVPRHLDAARRALDRLALAGDRLGVTVGVRNPARILGVPAPDELRRLLDELRGAPLVPALDLAAAHLDDAMGFRPLAAVVDAWSASPLALVADACGPVTGLPPGRGEVDLPTALAALAARKLAFHPAPSLALDEAAGGLAALRRLSGA